MPNQPGGTALYTFKESGDRRTGLRATRHARRRLRAVGRDAQIKNKAFGTEYVRRQNFLGLGSMSGSDVSTDTSGHQDEYFDQQANSTDIRWTVNDSSRSNTSSATPTISTTGPPDYDLTSNTDVTRTTTAPVTFSGDLQFYVSQETEYVSHELQFFNDWNDKLTTTTGLFYYQASISQRGDFYDSNSNGAFTRELQLRRRRSGRVRLGCRVRTVSEGRICSPRSKRASRRAVACPTSALVRSDFQRSRSASSLQAGITRSRSRSAAGTRAMRRRTPESFDSVPHGPTCRATNLSTRRAVEREAFAHLHAERLHVQRALRVDVGCALGA